MCYCLKKNINRHIFSLSNVLSFPIRCCVIHNGGVIWTKLQWCWKTQYKHHWWRRSDNLCDIYRDSCCALSFLLVQRFWCLTVTITVKKNIGKHRKNNSVHDQHRNSLQRPIHRYQCISCYLLNCLEQICKYGTSKDGLFLVPFIFYSGGELHSDSFFHYEIDSQV